MEGGHLFKVIITLTHKGLNLHTRERSVRPGNLERDVLQWLVQPATMFFQKKSFSRKQTCRRRGEAEPACTTIKETSEQTVEVGSVWQGKGEKYSSR